MLFYVIYLFLLIIWAFISYFSHWKNKWHLKRNPIIIIIIIQNIYSLPIFRQLECALCSCHQNNSWEIQNVLCCLVVVVSISFASLWPGAVLACSRSPVSIPEQFKINCSLSLLHVPTITSSGHWEAKWKHGVPELASHLSVVGPLLVPLTLFLFFCRLTFQDSLLVLWQDSQLQSKVEFAAWRAQWTDSRLNRKCLRGISKPELWAI